MAIIVLAIRNIPIAGGGISWLQAVTPKHNELCSWKLRALLELSGRYRVRLK